MKTIKQLLVVVMIALALPLFAAEEPAKQEPAMAAREIKTDYKDAFLQLALEKSKLYSGKVEDAIGSGVEYAKKEAPELAKEWITWRFYYHLLPVIASFIGLTIYVAGIIVIHKKGLRDEFIAPIWCICGGLVAIIATVHLLAGGDLLSLIQIKVAPRIYMIEEVSKLIRK